MSAVKLRYWSWCDACDSCSDLFSAERYEMCTVGKCVRHVIEVAALAPGKCVKVPVDVSLDAIDASGMY